MNNQLESGALLTKISDISTSWVDNGLGNVLVWYKAYHSRRSFKARDP
jgi:hypothetical protein